MTDHPRAVAAGVRKAPRHEIAGNVALTVPRALWGFRHESWRVELRLKRLLRSVLRQALAYASLWTSDLRAARQDFLGDC
jgi:hypothetical protein